MKFIKWLFSLYMDITKKLIVIYAILGVITMIPYKIDNKYWVWFLLIQAYTIAGIGLYNNWKSVRRLKDE